MKKLILVFVATFVISSGLKSYAQETDTTNRDTSNQTGTQSQASGDILQAISATGYNALLATAIKTAGLESTLQGSGPFTVFAPSDQGFTDAKVAVDSLMKDQQKLGTVLRNHVVQGRYTKNDIIKALSAGKGKTTLTTIDGNTLTLQVNANKNLELSDAAGNTALVTVFDQQATNGVVHVINNVLMPKE